MVEQNVVWRCYASGLWDFGTHSPAYGAFNGFCRQFFTLTVAPRPSLMCPLSGSLISSLTISHSLTILCQGCSKEVLVFWVENFFLEQSPSDCARYWVSLAPVHEIAATPPYYHVTIKSAPTRFWHSSEDSLCGFLACSHFNMPSLFSSQGCHVCLGSSSHDVSYYFSFVSFHITISKSIAQPSFWAFNMVWNYFLFFASFSFPFLSLECNLCENGTLYFTFTRYIGTLRSAWGIIGPQVFFYFMN